MIDIDAVVERYLRAVRAAGAPEGEPIGSTPEVQRVVKAVAPYIVPADVQRAWLRLSYWDWLIDDGGFQSPESSLEAWVGNIEHFEQPRLLFPISYASHTYLFVELGVVGGPQGGALLLAPLAEPLVRHAPSLAWAFGFLTERIEAGAAQWNEWWTRRIPEAEIQSAAASQSWPPHLIPTIDPSRSLTWPAHWQGASGINPADAMARGPDINIATMFTLGVGANCRIQGQIVALAVAAAGCRIGIEDESAGAIVWVGRLADPFGVVRIREWVELDITVASPSEEPSEQIFAEIATSPMPPEDDEAKLIAAKAMAMFDAASYRFQATVARPVER